LYREEQGIEAYDDMNREWRDIVLKKRSGGPSIGQASARSLQLFDMCSYDIDGFREFIQTPGFDEVFDLSFESKTEFAGDEGQLLLFAFRFLRQVLYGEETIPLKRDARERRQALRQSTENPGDASPDGS